MKYFFIAFCSLIFIVGCRKENEGPQEYTTDYYAFDSLDKNGTNAQLFLNNIYADMPTGFGRIGGDFLDAATDDAIPSRDGVTIETFTYAKLNNNNNPDDAWSKSYASIRKVNVFLSKVGVVPVPAQLPFWRAESRFLRALFYFELLKRYGGVPLIGDSIFQPTDNIQYKRNSFSDCVNYIVTECDSIKTMARKEPISSSDWGKASRGAVLALRSRVLLYAASPLFNGGVPAGASPDQQAVMGYPTYDATRWTKAAQAANDLITLNVYSLETALGNPFLNRQNTEVILSFLRSTTTDLETNNGPVGFSLNAIGYGQTSPTQDLVNAFGMTNGKAITDATSGYNPATPYVGRDARLASTVLYNTAPWLSRPLQTFEGGLDKPNLHVTQTKTGYYLRKFLGNFTASTQYSVQNHNFPIFRYAEILLNYAEAQNESAGPTVDVYTILKNIRKRAGIIIGTDGLYGLKAAMTQSDMRTTIQNERRVEMAFEEQRYWDLRRWKLSDQVLNKNLTGLIITKDALGNFTYQNNAVFPIVFPTKMFLYPVPYSELIRDNNLVQNYGW